MSYPSPEDKLTGANMRKARTASDLTQTQLAMLMVPPVTRSAVAKWESGDSIPTAKHLCQFAVVCATDVDTLVGW